MATIRTVGLLLMYVKLQPKKIKYNAHMVTSAGILTFNFTYRIWTS